MSTTLLDDSYTVKAILSQKTKVKADGITNYVHSANGTKVGSYEKRAGKVISFNGQPIDQRIVDLRVSDCEQAEGESCAGCHYRQMKEVIAQDGDATILCDGLNAMGNLCNI